MSIRNLDFLFDPASVAVVGASDRVGSLGGTVWRNLRSGGFAGPRWAVNHRHLSVGGERCYRRVADLPDAPDLAVLCTPAASLPGLVEELGARGTRAAIVVTAGIDAPTRQAMLDAARGNLLRLLGPNCLGLLSPHARLNASFAHANAEPGSLAFVSQSGALVTAMLDWAAGRGIGFSHCVSLGEHADIDFADLLDWLSSDPRTRSILLYIESVEQARKFMSAARAAARNKPVLVVKSGRSPLGRAAASSHTGALAGSDLVFDAAIRRAGMLRVDTLSDLFLAAETLAHFQASPAGDASALGERLTIVTNGGGAGVLAADAAAAMGVELAPLSAGLQARLELALPGTWSRGNPIDLIGDAPVERYTQAVAALLDEPQAGTLLFMHAPTAVVDSQSIATALVPVIAAAPQRLLAAWLGGPAVRDAQATFRAAGVPCYDTPEEAVHAFSLLVTYRRNQEQLLQAPAADDLPEATGADTIGALLDAVLADGREWLDEPEAKTLLAACGIPVVGTHVVAASADAAVEAATAIGYPVVLKILSPQVSHKSDVGGVVLGLTDEAALRAAVAAMRLRVASARPDAVIAGFTIQAMVRRPQAIELIVGASIDQLFGPVVLFGAGGTSVEVVADRAIGLPPLNAPLARALVGQTRIARLLAGWRDVPAADMAALTGVLSAVSRLLAAHPRITELDINPLLADADGVIALDARVRVDRAAPGGAARFAIVPYPSHLVQEVDWDGRRIVVRPIRPEDEAQHLAFLESLDPADVRMRVFYSRRSIERTELARLTQIDYAREMCFVATASTPSGEQTLGAVRATSDPDNIDAEFGIVVRSDLKGHGLGELLMHTMIDYLKGQGTRRLIGVVLQDNTRMRDLARRLGFEESARDDDGTRVVSLALAPVS